ncbi:MAG: VOC family protein [Gemmataceae bacterium]|nr:VOC family protein [Gemmata sp.]MDW8198249.1 VOC family protein [Gemmataceae bacterium]
MPAIDGILETALYVDDLSRSSRFYQTIFGFKPVAGDGERFMALHITGRQILLLFPKRRAPSAAHLAHEGNGRLHLAWAIATEELAAWEAWLHQHGLVVEEKKHWERGGWSLYFRDPDGHLLEVATPGIWPGVY